MSDLGEKLAEIEAKYCTMKVTSASLELGEWHDAFTKEVLTAVANAIRKNLYGQGAVLRWLRTQAKGDKI